MNNVLIEYLIEYHSKSKSEAKIIVENLFQKLFDELANNGEFRLPCNFGKFRIKKMSAKVIKVFGETKKVSARTKVTFRPGKALKELLK